MGRRLRIGIWGMTYYTNSHEKRTRTFLGWEVVAGCFIVVVLVIALARLAV